MPDTIQMEYGYVEALGIILAAKAVQTYLTEKFKAFGNSAATSITEMFRPEIYGQDEVARLIQYFGGVQVNVRFGYPNEDTTSPSVYVVPGDEHLETDVMGFGVRSALDNDTVATYEMKVYKKGVRVIATTDNPTLSAVLSAICEYYMHQQEEWFMAKNMINLAMAASELDAAILSKWLPQRLSHKSFIATFTVVDTYLVSKDDIIKGVTVNILGDTEFKENPYYVKK